MDPRHKFYAARQAPRYTSYPTAPHFTKAVNHQLFDRWLGELPPQGELSVYVHVPYCRQICWYCGCNTTATLRDQPVAHFVDTILREIELVGERTNARQVHELHWGGGTPNILSPAQFTRIYHELDFWFDIHPSARHSVEVDPRYLTEEHVVAFAEANITRASIGVQDFNAHVQQAIGRVQPTNVVAAAIERLREASIGEINMDLLYGLPHQSISDLLRSVRTAASMQPQRIALFGYAHVPWFKRRQRLMDEKALPSPAHRFDQAEAARTELAALGYIAIGLDHFALPRDELALAARRGDLHRNFQGYVAGSAKPILGFGPSSVSTLPQGYAQNHQEVGAWARAVSDEHLPVSRGHSLSDEDRRRAAFIEQIMCTFAADLGLLGGAQACTNELTLLQPLMDDGLVAVNGDSVTIPPPARQFCRLVAQAFDAYAPTAQTRHSTVV